MNCDRRLFILSLVLSVGLASTSVYADYSVTEICAGTFKSEGQLAGFNADTVVLDISQPSPFGTTPAEIKISQTFCTAAGGAGNCERTGFWSGAFGDDFPLNGLGPNPAVDCDYRFGPGAFDSLDTVGDMSSMNQFCMVVTNCDDAYVSVRTLLFTSLGKAGIALQIRTFAQSDVTWIEPGKSATICINFNDAEVQPTFEGGQTIPNTENVTGFGFEMGAYTPFTETRTECLDGNKDNNPSDCLNNPPAGPGLNRESDNVFVKMEQPRPEFVLEDQNLVYCNSSTMSATIRNDGTGALSITKATLTGANPGDFEVVSPLPFTVGANGGKGEFRVRYNNRDVDHHSASIVFESNALDKDTNIPLDHSLPENILDVHGFSTLVQNIVTQQDSATQFRAFVNLDISEFAPTGYIGENDFIPTGCGKITQIPSIGTRIGFDPSKIVATAVNVGRPTAEPNGAASGVETVEPPIVSLPCCETDDSDPPLNVATDWEVLDHTDLALANADGNIDVTVGDVGGTFIDTEDYTNRGPLVLGSDRHVTVEALSVTFELLTLTGCNTASVRFVTGPANNFFPNPHQSNVGSNPDVGTTILQDVGANSASNLGIPPNSFVRGDVDFNAQVNANDVVRVADVIFNTDGSEAEVAARIGQDCVAAVDITVDKSNDVRDLLTLIQLLFNITSNITPSDIAVLQDRQVSKASDLNKVIPVSWAGAGYERQVPNNDTSADDVKDDPSRFTCVEGLDCDEGDAAAAR